MENKNCGYPSPLNLLYKNVNANHENSQKLKLTKKIKGVNYGNFYIIFLDAFFSE